MAILADQIDPHQDVVFIEDPGKITYIWPTGKRAIQAQGRGGVLSIAQSVGGNKALAELMVEHARETLGALTIPVDPRRKGKKWSNEANWLAHLVAHRLIGEGGVDAVAGKTSEHSRDAAMYVAGETRPMSYWAQLKKK